MSAALLKDLDAAYSEWPQDIKLVRQSATRIRVLEKGIRDGLRLLTDLNDEEALNVLTQALRDGYDKD